jgi:hypothetical protein
MGGVKVQLTHILFEGEWSYSGSDRFTLGESTLCTHRIESSVGSRADVDVVEKNPYPCRESNPARPARRKSQMLSSPGTTLLNNQQLTPSYSSIIFLPKNDRIYDITCLYRHGLETRPSVSLRDKVNALVTSVVSLPTLIKYSGRKCEHKFRS